MKKYRVMVRGQNLLADVDGVRQRFGFYTNVFVEAVAPADAESQAIEVVRKDFILQDLTLNALDDPLKLSVDKILEVESVDVKRLSRSGLSLYPENAGVK